MDESGLLKLKQKIDDAKQTSSELKGQQTALMQQLKTEYKCNSLKEAQEKLKKMDEEIETINTQIDEGLKELEGKYEQN
jgi:uncharacterized phage infection (PIP) family protein YhgE